MTRKRTRVQLLAADPGLGEGLDEAELGLARRALPTPVLVLERGEWRPDVAEHEAGHLGYLVAEGSLVRRVEVARGSSVELLGPGDLLRPWQEDASSFCNASWEVLAPTTLLLLEPPVARQLSHWPVIASNLVARGLRRSRSMAADTAVANIVGLEERLLILLWQLAETWGRTDPDGVRLGLKLPHRLLADLVGARRPSVTSALADLQEAGRLEVLPDGSWRLRGGPPC